MRVVIDGGPGTGKTSVIKALRKRKYNVKPEAARIVLHRKKYRENTHLTKKQLAGIQRAIWNLSLKEYQQASRKKDKLIFFDRGIISGFSYLKLEKIKITKAMLKQAASLTYEYVYIMHPLPRRLYATDTVRRESYTKSLQIHRQIVRFYKQFGYRPCIVPFDTVEKRVQFILKRIKQAESRSSVLFVTS